MTTHKPGQNMENSQELDQLFPINDEEWLNLRTKIQTTQDLDFIEWIYEQLGDLELQLAYTFHVHEQRTAELHGE